MALKTIYAERNMNEVNGLSYISSVRIEDHEKNKEELLELARRYSRARKRCKEGKKPHRPLIEHKEGFKAFIEDIKENDYKAQFFMYF